MMFNIKKKNHVDEFLIWHEYRTFCNVRTNYYSCIIIEKVEYLKYWLLS